MLCGVAVLALHVTSKTLLVSGRIGHLRSQLSGLKSQLVAIASKPPAVINRSELDRTTRELAEEITRLSPQLSREHDSFTFRNISCAVTGLYAGECPASQPQLPRPRVHEESKISVWRAAQKAALAEGPQSAMYVVACLFRFIARFLPQAEAQADGMFTHRYRCAI